VWVWVWVWVCGCVGVWVCGCGFVGVGLWVWVCGGALCVKRVIRRHPCQAHTHIHARTHTHIHTHAHTHTYTHTGGCRLGPQCSVQVPHPRRHRCHLEGCRSPTAYQEPGVCVCVYVCVCVHACVYVRALPFGWVSLACCLPRTWCVCVCVCVRACVRCHLGGCRSPAAYQEPGVCVCV